MEKKSIKYVYWFGLDNYFSFTDYDQNGEKF